LRISAPSDSTGAEHVMPRHTYATVPAFGALSASAGGRSRAFDGTATSMRRGSYSLSSSVVQVARLSEETRYTTIVGGSVNSSSAISRLPCPCG